MSYLDTAGLVWKIVRAISPAIVAMTTIAGIWLCVSGFVPVLIRLGNGLKRRKIAIFAKGDMRGSLHALFADSKLFNTKNIISVTHDGDFGRAEDASVYLVHWPDWPDEMARIIALKKDAVPLVLYAPQGKGQVPPETIALLEQQRNVALANLRGRLLNDVVVSLITSAYAKK
ncbi:hypothetical protein [Brevundimonas nasdae]|uniref:Uncharacterized protein n=1 Tax=Brevundimonas nasdae TaxID=172043 RepID=A0ABX8TGH2_9CAUL|nr:hypothetical protein [Brevundimonas nasdae]QYC10328.1 hypothetical protein KWG56_17580 [Brevundimonas nasdae]QYC13116.1 hypothetical protein KWG63_12900 [Brevundimonas nasdae]